MNMGAWNVNRVPWIVIMGLHYVIMGPGNVNRGPSNVNRGLGKVLWELVM